MWVIRCVPHTFLPANVSLGDAEETAIDTDNPGHLQWLFEKARDRAAEFNISVCGWHGFVPAVNVCWGMRLLNACIAHQSIKTDSCADYVV